MQTVEETRRVLAWLDSLKPGSLVMDYRKRIWTKNDQGRWFVNHAFPYPSTYLADRRNPLVLVSPGRLREHRKEQVIKILAKSLEHSYDHPDIDLMAEEILDALDGVA
jgi:hypothetical protein